jgi:branched-chain amino acid transport system substrate-binding protein
MLNATIAYADRIVMIGSAAPLSGPGAYQDKDIGNGAQMAIDDLSAGGVSIGGEKLSVC